MLKMLNKLLILLKKLKEIKMISEKVEKIIILNLSISIEESDQSVCIYNFLQKKGIQNLKELTNKTEDEVKKFENLG